MKSIRIAGSCVNQTPLNWSQNLENILNVIRLARSEEVSILCLPELAISGYGCEDTFFSDSVLERSLANLKLIAEASENIVVSVGLPMEYEHCLHNVVCLIQNKQILGFVAKQELAGDGIHYEPRWFKPWTENRIVNYKIDGQSYPFGDVIFEIDGVRIGFEICEDAWNGIRPAQRHYQNNVDIIMNPSASHFAFGKSKIREGLVTEASRQYSCAYVYSNLLGNESGRVVYDGEIIIAQSGTLLAQNQRFSFKDFQLVDAVIDIELPRRSKKKSFSFNPVPPTNVVYGVANLDEVAANLTEPKQIPPPTSKDEEFFRAVTLGLFDYMRKSFSRGFVVSLSGGADSSACAVLSSFALQNALAELGEEAFRAKLSYLKFEADRPLINQLLTCVYQGTDNSSVKTLQSARELATGLGAEWHNWKIGGILSDYHKMIEKSIGRKLNWDQDDITLQNIQARVRAPGIWMMANIKNALLLTTSNRSEAAVGYATMDGDTAGGLAPLGGIDKATLVNWLHWAEKTLGVKELKYVNNLQPTAELRPAEKAQTDETDLMPYPILDKIEKCAIRDYKSPVEVFRTLRGVASDEALKGYIKKFFTLWSRNQWKRERYAPSFHLDDENLDPRTWCRFPILSGSFKQELKDLEDLVV